MVEEQIGNNRGTRATGKWTFDESPLGINQEPALDDGTWNPVVVNESFADMSSVITTGHYMRVGNHVHFGICLTNFQTVMDENICLVSLPPITENDFDNLDIYLVATTNLVSLQQVGEYGVISTRAASRQLELLIHDSAPANITTAYITGIFLLV